MKRIIFVLLICMLSGSGKAQQTVPGAVSVTRKWEDKNGHNLLTVRGQDLCNPDYENGAWDGFPSKVEIALVNDRYNLFLADSLTLDQCRICSMLVRESEIWTTPFQDATIVFVPLFYCGTYDSDTRISYVVLYEGHKWLVDVQYLYEPDGEGIFRLNDGLEDKLGDTGPEELKNIIIDQIGRRYTTAVAYESVFFRETVVDTLFFDDKVCLLGDMVLLENRPIYCFGGKGLSFLYFQRVACLEHKGKKYLYLYPRYREIYGPYMWYGLGVLIEFNKRGFKIKEYYDYFDENEVEKVFKFKKSFLPE